MYAHSRPYFVPSLWLHQCPLQQSSQFSLVKLWVDINTMATLTRQSICMPWWTAHDIIGTESTTSTSSYARVASVPHPPIIAMVTVRPNEFSCQTRVLPQVSHAQWNSPQKSLSYSMHYTLATTGVSSNKFASKIISGPAHDRYRWNSRAYSF